ncbi:HesB/YadR/YfhF family protein [Aerococcus suis]|uniref:Uncharacterized protein YneR n=1 Tax=Aerococcus suis TaxID=371602 RepID=A0A1W1Y6G6_9LACT|nr:iron-sulfur cluster biosynthesis protein [Aerococcus suis]MCI7240438.1 iron-sulfur cluster biosynthesis protein [Aerococcus suis]MDD7758374.1 iron-sulfur cluster biosynthesis protein [Aerococcus suis]MDY4646968.1 iron-sulfur cluster biosynthesis protein [Aerococcus suis]SMC31725.1 Uncharacterized protein YneR [Aerococcus suis]
MEITVTDAAHQYVQDEMGLTSGDGLKFSSKVYGKTQIHEGFSVAIHVEKPNGDTLAKTEKDGITYFTTPEDDWFFAGHNFHVDFDSDKENFIYTFTD